VRRIYVDIAGVSDEQLEMLGYYLVERNEMWSLYMNKGEAFVVNEHNGKRFIFVEDINDAIILKGAGGIEAPPAD
jgi:hypothetical protein